MPDDVTPDLLDREWRRELATLPGPVASRVARHLVMVGRLIEDDPETAYHHARVARAQASRIGVVREACGLAAYHTERWAEALAELRAARRLTGSDAYLPIMADCERGLGRPRKALELARAPEVARLDRSEQVEMKIVESGARRDLRETAAAVVALQIPELTDNLRHPWSARLFYAYADALLADGREEDAIAWFARAAAADRTGDTDAAERYALLTGGVIEDAVEDVEEPGVAPAPFNEPGDDEQRPVSPEIS